MLVQDYRSPTFHEIATALYINGDKRLLVQEVAKQNKAALFQLVMLNMPYIVSAVEGMIRPPKSLTSLIDAATNQLIRLIEESASDLPEENFSLDWHAAIFKHLNAAILPSFKRNPKASYETPEHLIFLNQMNRLLTEKEIAKQAVSFLKLGEQMRKDGNAFTTDFMVEAEVQYYTSDGDDASHAYSHYFNYDEAVFEEDYSDDDWRESYMPKLEQPYCYLMHDLMDHSRLGNKLFEIDRIWIDIRATAQQGLKITRDGRSRYLRLMNDGFE